MLRISQIQAQGKRIGKSVALSSGLVETFNNISNELAQGTKQDLQPKIDELIINIGKVIQQLNQIVKNPKTHYQWRKNVLVESYYFIMQIREFFTKDTINYRIYYSPNSKAGLENMVGTKVINLTTEELLSFVHVDGSALRLNATLSPLLKKTSRLDQEMSEKFDQHWKNLMDSLKPVQLKTKTGSQTYYMAIKSVRDRFEKNLIQQKHPRTPAVFNRGHLYEAFEATIYDLNKRNKEITDASVYYTYFSEKLTYDQEKGFKSGDVGENQIKARRAQLMDAATLYKYLIDIKSIFDQLIRINSSFNVNDISKALSELFINKEQQEKSQQLEKNISNEVDSLVKNLTR